LLILGGVMFRLYSLSFEQNAGWTKLLLAYDIIRAYIEIWWTNTSYTHIWLSDQNANPLIGTVQVTYWTTNTRNLDSSKVFVHECRVLFSAVRHLGDPLDLYILQAVRHEKGQEWLQLSLPSTFLKWLALRWRDNITMTFHLLMLTTKYSRQSFTCNAQITWDVSYLRWYLLLVVQSFYRNGPCSFLTATFRGS